MDWLALTIVAALAAQPQPLGPGNHLRTVDSDGRSRTYLVHIPPQYDARKPTPVVLSFHGVMTNGAMQARFSGLNRKADEAGFVAVYPYGTGAANLLLAWNAGETPRRNPPGDEATAQAERGVPVRGRHASRRHTSETSTPAGAARHLS